jgi:hypothetical protein
VTNMARPAERVVAFYNQRGTAEQYIREGKNAVKWTRLSCRTFRNNAVRLQLHALAYNLANFMRTLALPDQVAHWSLTTLREKLVKSVSPISASPKRSSTRAGSRSARLRCSLRLSVALEPEARLRPAETDEVSRNRSLVLALQLHGAPLA